jgi:hypothetical protein
LSIYFEDPTTKSHVMSEMSLKIDWNARRVVCAPMGGTKKILSFQEPLRHSQLKMLWAAGDEFLADVIVTESDA